MSQRFSTYFPTVTAVLVTGRNFLSGAAMLAGIVRGQSPQRVWSDQVKRDRIGVMTLSFDRVLKSARHPDDPSRTLDILDAPQMIADRYGVHHVEFQHSHLASTDSSYFRELRGRLRQAKSQMNQICLEFGHLNISSPDPVLRNETVDLTKQWIDHAAELGCRRVMLNQGTLAPKVRQPAIDTLQRMAGYGKQKKVCITLESRGYGPTPTNPSWEVVVEVIKAAGIHARACPQLKEFPVGR
jgi:hypothetical protein